MLVPFRTLGEHGSDGESTGISAELERLRVVCLQQNRGLRESSLESCEGPLLLQVPSPFRRFLRESRKRFGDLGEIRDKPPKPRSSCEKGDQWFDAPWFLHLNESSSFCRVRKNAIGR